MNKFAYEAAKQQLLALSTVKSLDDTVRKYAQLSGSRHYTQDIFTTKQYEEAKHNYKLFALALKLYTAKSKQTLPDFVYARHVATQKSLTDRILKLAPTIPQAANYAEFVDLFEFDSEVWLLQGYSYCYIPSLHAIILDQPIHFKVNWNDDLSAFDNYSLSNSLNNTIKYFIKAMRYKQTLCPAKPSTILDQYLADCRKSITTRSTPNTQILTSSIQLLMAQTAATLAVELELSTSNV
jgi:hypothetical protein